MVLQMKVERPAGNVDDCVLVVDRTLVQEFREVLG